MNKLMQKELKYFISIIILITTGCSNTKYLEEGQQLYIGHKFKIESEEKLPNKKEVIDEVEKVIVPKPNTSVLGLRPRLWFYNIAGTPKGKGLRHFLKNSMGEPPVLWETVDIDRTIDLIKNRLYNHGYFRAKVDYEIKQKNKKVKVLYTANVSAPYTLSMIFFPDGTTDLRAAVQNTVGNTILEEGEPYNLSQFIEERERIDTALKNQGFYYFNPEYLVFRVDSTPGDRKLNVYLQLKEDIPIEAEKIYYLNNIYVFPDYSLGRDSIKPSADSVEVSDGFFMVGKGVVKPKVLDRTILFEKGNKYRRKDHDYTLNRLMNLGTYKFVNIRFDDVDTAGNGYLNAFIYLTPLKKKSIRLELQGVSKSNNFIGPAFTSKFLNRNFLGGAELLSFNVNSGFETQFNQPEGSNFNSYKIGVETEVRVPKFITPFKITNVSSRFMPRTTIKLGAEQLSRVEYYNLNSFKFSAGYNWRESLTKEHELIPFSVNFLNLYSTTEKFDEILAANPILAQSFSEQFILGPNYTFTFNDQVLEDKINNYYFSVNADFSGNLIYAIQSLTTEKKPTSEEPFTVFNAPYSQYGRLFIDFRHFNKTTEITQLASRLILGGGYPYGNSFTLPYIKQFFIGGSNSIRAFRPRSLGPGTYKPPETSIFLDQAGDLKLEANTEFRFPIISILKGAVFIDAGNIWLVKENPFVPGGKFEWNDFYKELAVGTGLGIRLDASFFVLRFDLGIPLRKPFLPEGERWVLDQVDFSSSEWRRENLILNVAIGYPY